MDIPADYPASPASPAAAPKARREPRHRARNRIPRPASAKRHVTPPKLRKALHIAIWLYAIFAFYIAFGKGHPLEAVCGTAVVVAALIPAFLWVTGRAKGYPLMPLFCFCYTYAFGIQFLKNEKVLHAAQPGDLTFACAALCIFLLVAGGIWYSMVRRSQAPPRVARVLEGTKANAALMTSFFLFTTFQVIEAASLTWPIFGSAFSLVRSIMYSLGAISTFALCYSFGQRTLSRPAQIFFLTLFAIAVMAGCCRLILIQMLSMLFLSVLGFTMGRQRVPWKMILIITPLLAMLQYGKYSMRDLTWTSPTARPEFRLMPWEYPGFYSMWMSQAFAYTNSDQSTRGERPDLLERASLLQMFLLIHHLSPHTVPFIGGETYNSVLSSSLPRIFFPNKASALESTNLISIHYGLQSREDTGTTTIGWGLFNEAFANFGFKGILMLSVTLGLFFGWATRFTMGYPILSDRGLFAVIIMNTAFQTEYSMATAVSATFQATVMLAAMSILIMHRLPVRTASPLATAPEFIQILGRQRPKGIQRRPRRLSV